MTKNAQNGLSKFQADIFPQIFNIQFTDTDRFNTQTVSFIYLIETWEIVE